MYSAGVCPLGRDEVGVQTIAHLGCRDASVGHNDGLRASGPWRRGVGDGITLRRKALSGDSNFSIQQTRIPPNQSEPIRSKLQDAGIGLAFATEVVADANVLTGTLPKDQPGSAGAVPAGALRRQRQDRKSVV